MPRDHQRSHRVEEQIHRRLAELIRREVKDPRVGALTITAVEVSRDLSHAKVFFLPFDSTRPTDEILAALGSAAGFLRIHLKKHLKMRHVPELHFEPDQTIDKAVRLSALINRAVASDVEWAATVAPKAETTPAADEPAE